MRKGNCLEGSNDFAFTSKQADVVSSVLDNRHSSAMRRESRWINALLHRIPPSDVVCDGHCHFPREGGTVETRLSQYLCCKRRRLSHTLSTAFCAITVIHFFTYRDVASTIMPLCFIHFWRIQPPQSDFQHCTKLPPRLFHSWFAIRLVYLLAKVSPCFRHHRVMILPTHGQKSPCQSLSGKWFELRNSNDG